MSKMTELQAQLEKASGKAPASVKPAVAPPEIAPASYKAPSRDGKIHIGAYLHPDFKRSLRLVQAQTGEDTQSILARALNEIFRSHNVPVIDHD
jgi:hypothetical protein